ncbi:MAG: DUF438 domain-containing protein [Candidatus Atribacteria bacterium]|nr:DUF438 domain-containing protein [Candidatus Atribacteria bacterium]
MENALIKEGFPPEQIQKLCEVHVSVFDATLKKYRSPKHMPGHPVNTYMEENKYAKKLVKSISPLFKKIVKTKEKGVELLSRQLHELKQIELHFQRKENQLFPKLEKEEFSGPSKVMWGKHDEIRNRLKIIEKALQDGDFKQVKDTGKELISAIRNMIFMEEKILFPTSLRKLKETDWIEIRKEEPEIGYAWTKPGNLWDINIARTKQQETIKTETVPSNITSDTVHIDEGNLTFKQINLMLKHLPVDVTFVDENDKVRYYSQGKERIFPRSPAIIGRDVQNCHPPKSVHIVNKIVESFRKKEKDVAEFWLTMNDRFIHIRYFAVYDDAGEYKGVIEVSQDVTDIRALDGERRLLDW